MGECSDEMFEAKKRNNKKSKKKQYHKVVRDRIINQIVASGSKFEAKRIEERDWVWFLAKKLEEESKEVVSEVDHFFTAFNYEDIKGNKSKISKCKILEEIADTFDVMIELMKVYGFTSEDLVDMVKHKRAKSGGFEDHMFLEWVEEQA